MVWSVKRQYGRVSIEAEWLDEMGHHSKIVSMLFPINPLGKLATAGAANSFFPWGRLGSPLGFTGSRDVRDPATLTGDMA